MSDENFVDLVRKLRSAQQRWFKYKNQDALTRAKQLERDVDRWLERDAGPRAAPSLFDKKAGEPCS